MNAQVQQVPVQMHPIIRNPEAISDDEMPDPGVQVQVPQMQPGVQVQVIPPQVQPQVQVIHAQVQPQAQVICPQVQPFRITQPNPPILKFTTGLVIHTCAGC